MYLLFFEGKTENLMHQSVKIKEKQETFYSSDSCNVINIDHIFSLPNLFDQQIFPIGPGVWTKAPLEVEPTLENTIPYTSTASVIPQEMSMNIHHNGWQANHIVCVCIHIYLAY